VGVLGLIAIGLLLLGAVLMANGLLTRDAMGLSGAALIVGFLMLAVGAILFSLAWARWKKRP
jgi:hypothetical protein